MKWNKIFLWLSVPLWTSSAYAQVRNLQDLGTRFDELTTSTILSVVGLLALGVTLRFILDLRNSNPEEQFSWSPRYLLPTMVTSAGCGFFVLVVTEWYISKGTAAEPHDVPIMIEGGLVILGAINFKIVLNLMQRIYSLAESWVLNKVNLLFPKSKSDEDIK